MLVRAARRPLRILLGLICLVILAASGCWDQRELDDQLHVLSAYLDLEPDGMLRLTVEVISLIGGKSGESEHAVLSTLGVSIEDAMWQMRWIAEAIPNLAHLEVLVFGEELARQGLRDLLDTLAQNYQVRRSLFVAITPGRAADLLTAALTTSRHSEQLLGMLERAATGAGDVTQTSLNALLRDLSTAGIEAVVAQLSLTPAPDVEHVTEHAQGRMEAASGETDHSGGDGSGGPAGPPLAALGGAALFDDDRLVAFLHPTQAIGVTWLRAPMRDRLVWIPTGPGRQGFGLHVASTVPRLCVTESNGVLTIRCGVKVTGAVRDFQGTGDMRTPQDIAMLVKHATGHIQSQIEDAFEHTLSGLGLDVIGCGRYLLRYNPGLWDRYRDVWPEPLMAAEMTVEVDVQIVGGGMLNAKQLGPGQAPTHRSW